MLSRFSTESLARTSAAHPRRTLLIWVMAIVVGVFLISTLLGSAVTLEDRIKSDPEW